MTHTELTLEFLGHVVEFCQKRNFIDEKIIILFRRKRSPKLMNVHK